MSDQRLERKLSEALQAVLEEQAGAARYAQHQRELRTQAARRATGPRPREFDANGFPVAQPNSTLRDRIARLLNPS